VSDSLPVPRPAMSLLPECHRWSQRALLALDDTIRGGSEEMHLQAALGISSMYTMGSSEQSHAALTRGLEFAEKFHDPVEQFRLIGQLHSFYRRAGNFDRMLAVAQRGEAVGRKWPIQPGSWPRIRCSLIRQNFALLNSKWNFADSESSRFQRLSASIGRFLVPRSQRRTSSSRQKDRQYLNAIDVSSATIRHRKARRRQTSAMIEKSKTRLRRRRGPERPWTEDAPENSMRRCV
jgi:hypothetical protein